MRFLYVSLILTASCSLCACHNDMSEPIPPLSDITYDSSSGLQLFYNGEPMPGKTVKISQSGNNAHITAFSTFDLSQISGMGLSGKIPAPGVLPGSPKLELDTEIQNTGEYWEFSGTSQTAFCSFNYAGYADSNNLKLYITDAALKGAVISPQVWAPSPIKQNPDGTYSSLPFYIDWKYDPLPDVDINLSAFLEALATLPVIPVYNNTAYMSVSEALSEVVKTIAFRQDGNIIISYVSTVGGAAQIAQTQPNGYQYVISSPTTISLYLNPLSLFSTLLMATSGSTPASEVNLTDTGLFPYGSYSTGKPDASSNPLEPEFTQKIAKAALLALLPKLADGIPLEFSATASNLNIFIGTETALSLIQQILLPVISEDSNIQAIEKYLAGNPAFAHLLPNLKRALELIPEALLKTTTFKFGFSLVPYQTPPTN